MSFLGSWDIDDTLYFEVNTHVAATGAATDADSVPTYRVYEAATATPLLTGSMALFDSANTVGFYQASITLSAANGFEYKKHYVIYITATVSSITGTTNHTFQIAASAFLANTAHGGTAATVRLGGSTATPALYVTNSGGDAVQFEATGANGHGIEILGNALGDGVHIIGGATGDGFSVSGGATSGVGVRIETGGNSSALLISSSSGYGIDVSGGLILIANATQEGMYIIGSTNGITIESGASGAGIQITGGGTGAGIVVNAGTLGNGLEINGGLTAGNGAIITAQTSGAGLRLQGGGGSHGLLTIGGATGAGIRALGGSTSGPGAQFVSQTSGFGAEFNAAGATGSGIWAQGIGTGSGIIAIGGATGNGINAQGGSTSGDGMRAIGVGDGDGIETVAVGAGNYGLKGTIGALLIAQTELAATPAITASLTDMLKWFFILSRNERRTTATSDLVRNDANSATLATSVLSDDGTTFIRQEYA